MTRDISHYFDWAATSPADKDILEKALELSLENYGNPSSQHDEGIKAKNALEDARKRAGEALNVNANTLYFTSGGTESDHIPLLSMLTRPQKGNIIISGIEHPALREQAAALKACGWKINTVLPNKDGFITADSITEKIDEDTAFISVMAVNNETGAIQPIYEISDAITKATQGKRRPKFHVDCVQAAGKIALNLQYKGIDSAAFSSHKICGPRGIGLLYLSKEITPFLKGGGQEKNIRSGTENLFGAYAFSLCLERYCISERNPKALERLEKQEEYT
ncbi:MAG: aminotransferase class V-fold PLP-dependent enzyme, partial [Treponema sp.]|nr:aminotransferase class V-fold PLP-dependent enzyme [Treponema sp.]